MLLQDAIAKGSFRVKGMSDDALIGVKGSFRCSGMTVEIPPAAGSAADAFHFDLLTMEGRRVQFYVESENDRQRWVDAIQSAAKADAHAELAGTEPDAGRSFRIFVERQSRNYTLRAASEEERDQWMERLRVRLFYPNLFLTWRRRPKMRVDSAFLE